MIDDMMLLLFIALGAQMFLLLSADAKCSEKDFAGEWAFMESGTVGLPTVAFNNVGAVRFDEKGRVLGGWATIAIGNSQHAQYSTYSGNLTVIPPCNVRLQLNRPDASFSLQGVVSKGKREFFTYSRQPDEYVLGHFARIDRKKCQGKDMDGVFVTSGIRNETLPLATMKVFAETFACWNKGICTVWASGNPGQSDIVRGPYKITKDPTLLCQYNMPGKTLVRHARGFFALVREWMASGSHSYVEGER
jgi:hypothetical protein